jgi:hypothetical protein
MCLLNTYHQGSDQMSTKLKETYKYRGHRVYISTVLKWAGPAYAGKANEALIGHWLTQGPTTYRKELAQGKLIKEAGKIAALMAKFMLQLVPLRTAHASI